MGGIKGKGWIQCPFCRRSFLPLHNVPITYSKRQLVVMQFVSRYFSEFGCAPTIKEIATEFGLKKATIFVVLRSLTRKGALGRTRKGSWRDSVIIDRQFINNFEKEEQDGQAKRW